MKGKKNPFAFMSGTYDHIMEELKRGGSKASYLHVEQTVGLDHKNLLRLKKGPM